MEYGKIIHLAVSNIIMASLIILLFILMQYLLMYPLLLTKVIDKEISFSEYIEVEGKSVKSIYVKGDPKLPIVIYFHGNNELIGDVYGFLNKNLKKYNIGFLMVEYGGYGDTDGLVSLNGVNKAVLTALRHYEVEDREMVLFGRSIGTAHAFDFLFNHPENISKIIVLSGFISPVNIYSIKEDTVNMLDKIMYFNYNLKNKIIKYKNSKKVEALIVHGESDQLFNVGVASKIEELLINNNFSVKKIISNGDHNNINIDFEEYIKFIIGEAELKKKKEIKKDNLQKLSLIKDFETKVIKSEVRN